MSENKANLKEDRLLANDPEIKGNFQVDWGRQGTVIFAYIFVLLGYFGIVANIILVNDIGYWIPYPQMAPTILFWTFIVYPRTFYLPILILFLTSFLLTYKEDIPHYGIKASLWLVPSLIAEGFLFYWIMFGFNAEPFILQFAHWEGYLNILILFGCTFTGAFGGMKVKQIIKNKRKI